MVKLSLRKSPTLPPTSTHWIDWFGPQGWSECFGDDLLTVPGVESQFLGYPSLSLAADALRLSLLYRYSDTSANE
jgi:hypothetical protein